jgi:hypothetical protein
MAAKKMVLIMDVDCGVKRVVRNIRHVFHQGK